MESLILLFIPLCRPSLVQLSKLTHAPIELFKEVNTVSLGILYPFIAFVNIFIMRRYAPNKLLKKNVRGQADRENCSD